jgi:UDP-N-acetylmuramate--alanine ligase
LILDGYKTPVGVAGTHGKTTTSGMISSIMAATGSDHSAIIGGKVKHLNSSYIIGRDDDVCVFESCEYKESYLSFRPFVSVVVNVAEDHMEYFKTLDNLIASFGRYTGNVKDGGELILNAEDENSMTMLERSGYNGKVTLFGIEKGDIIVMVSDGAVQNNEDNAFIAELIKLDTEKSTSELAKEISEKCTDCDEPHDDISICVIKAMEENA